MGFQIVEHEGELLVALSSTIVMPLKELRADSSSSGRLANIFMDMEAEIALDLESITLTPSLKLAYSQLDRSVSHPDVVLNSPDQVSGPPLGLSKSRRPMNYYRFSASPTDKRVDRYGNYLPGTYATTYADFHLVPSGFAAVGRYALPNPASARFLFQITTYDRPTYMGTATPNFGQAGGGVEVLFDQGAKNNAGASYMIDAG